MLLLFTTAINGLTQLLGKIEQLDQKLPGTAAHASIFGGGLLAALTGGTASTIAGKLGLSGVSSLLGFGSGVGGVAALASIPSLSIDAGHAAAPYVKNMLDSFGEANSKAHAVKYFKSMGWTEEQARGLVDRAGKESGFKTNAVGDSGNAYGIMQWHPDRQAEFEAFAHKDIRESTLDEQLAFMHYELTKGNEQRAGRMLRGTSSEEGAEGIATGYYARPAATQSITMHITGANAEEIGQEVMRQLNTTQNSQTYSQRNLGSNY